MRLTWRGLSLGEVTAAGTLDTVHGQWFERDFVFESEGQPRRAQFEGYGFGECPRVGEYVVTELISGQPEQGWRAVFDTVER